MTSKRYSILTTAYADPKGRVRRMTLWLTYSLVSRRQDILLTRDTVSYLPGHLSRVALERMYLLRVTLWRGTDSSSQSMQIPGGESKKSDLASAP